MHDAPQHGPRPLPLFLDMLREQTAASPERRAAALAGLKAYQEAPRARKRRLAPARFRRGRARLRDYGGTGRPVIFVPSLINPPFILDLAPQNSLLRWCSEQGLHPYLLDWGDPTPADRDLDATAHVERILLPLIARFDAPPLLVGYCLGGTLALAAAATGAVAGVALIATPWHFAGFSGGRLAIGELWGAAKPSCAAIGLVPMEVLQTGFWRLDPERTIAKYEAFGRMEPGSAGWQGFIALEDWANAGAPLPYAVGRQVFEDFVGGDLTGTGGWRVAGHTVDPHTLPCPSVEFVSLTDRIVPKESAADLADRRDLGSGHVGMIVGGRARAQLWEPLADWLKHA
ncbi:MAG: alpha/beta hydrolase [Sphingomonas sp.]|uniref:alpha/beta hydrolase n=1 Tax=Sphingomonas sp. TaxID=28214 RepID=UPI003F80EA39